MQRANPCHAKETLRRARPTYREEDRSEDAEAEARHVDVVACAVDQQRKPAEEVREEDVQPCARVMLVVEAHAWHTWCFVREEVSHALRSGPWRVRCAHRTVLRDDLSAPLPSTAGRVPTSRWVLVVLYVRHGWRVAAEQGAFAALFSPTQPSPVPRKWGGGRGL